MSQFEGAVIRHWKPTHAVEKARGSGAEENFQPNDMLVSTSRSKPLGPSGIEQGGRATV